MKICLKLLIVLMLFNSCNKDRKVYAEKDLEGVWQKVYKDSLGQEILINHEGPPGWYEYQSPLILNNDSIFKLYNFKIKDDTIFRNSRLVRSHILKDSVDDLIAFYKILSFDSIHLTVIRILNNRSGDTISFKHPHSVLNKANHVKLKEFGFASSACFGRCPQSCYKVRSDSLFYDGIDYVKNVGHFEGKTDVTLWNEMSNLFQDVDLSMEDTSYVNNGIDDANIFYYLITDRDTMRFCCERSPSNMELLAMYKLTGCYTSQLKTTGKARRTGFEMLRH